MTTAYIWLGKNSEIDSSTGKINLDQLGSDKWTVRPLLDWTKDPSNSALDSFIPALVVHGDNPALKALLELLDAQLDNKPIGEPWKVFKFDRMAMTAVGGAINLADVPNSEHLFVPHKEIAFHLEAPQSALTLGPQVLTLKTATVDVQAHNSGDAAAIVLILNFKTLDLKPFNFDKSFDLTGKSLILAFDTGTGKLTVNGIPLNSDQDLPVTGAKHIPLGSQGELALTVDGETGSRDLGFEIEIANGSYTHKPLIPAIADSEVKITWPKIRVRLHKDRLGLAFPPGTPGDNILEASFKIPLIQAAVGPDAANLLARLIPTADSELKTVLSPLEFKVAIDRPTATLNIEPLLAVFKRVGHELEPVGSLAQEALATLKAKIINDDTPKSTVLSGMFAPLKELTADLNSKLKFTLDSIKGVIEGEFAFLEQFNTFNYKLPVALRISQDDKNELVCLVALQIDLWAGRLADNRAYYYLMQRKSGPVLTPGILDVSSFALQVPVRTVDEIQKLGLPTPEKHDGYLDFESLDVVFDMQAQFGDGRQMMVLFPGDLDKNKSENNKNRVRLLLEDFDPAIWPEKPQEKSGRTLRLRLGQRGLTLAAKAETVTPAEIPIPGAEESTDKTLAIRLVETRDGLRSALVVIDNQIRYADLAGRVAVPGFDGLEADIRLGLRRSAVEGPPVVVAAIDLDRTDRKPLARLKLPFLKAQLDDLRMQLTWTKKLGSNTPDWDLKAWASGAVSLTGDIKSTGGVQNLDQPRAIPFRDLELTELHKSKGKITLSGTAQHPTTKGNGNPAPSAADEVARFKLLDGQFLVEFQKALLEWDLQAKTMGFTAESARFTYQGNSGELFVDVHAGSIGLDLSVGSRSMKFKLSKSVGLEVRIGTQITFAGEVGWEDNAREHFFRADGRLRMTGFPEVAGSLKLGTGIKDDGAVVPNLAVFAELPFEADLFPGVVMKRLGVGLGLNNRLAAIGDRPDPRAILARIDEIDPKQSRNWSFVSQKGVYVSVVATTMLASNRGDVVCAYLAKLVLSLDTNLDVVAAAKIWLFSSAKFLEKGDNDRRPALIGAAVLQPRQKTFSLVAQTSPRPAIEGNKSISDLLNKVHARFSFYLSPELADYYLEELSYSDTLFGISVRANGSYRIAIGKFGALVRAQLALVGTLPEKNLTGGIGGFTFSGGLQLNADFGGLVSPSGLTAYGAVSLGITFRVSAYVMVPTIVFQTIEYEQTFSITISIPYLKCKKWRCKWQTREITETTTVRVSLTVPVLRIEPYHLPTTSLQLTLDGTLAFNESGGIGFSGTVGISVSVCGHLLRIAPRFDYRRDVVDAVRSRVAKVEDNINRLRRLPRAPVQASTADTGPAEIPEVETWYYYTSRNGDKTLHLLVPSPEHPTWWYTPHAANLSQYANLPRDTSRSAAEQGASETEREHLSPLRDSVMRMVLPFTDANDKLQRVVDLAMPWDRANFDSLPDEKAIPDDQQRIALVMRLSEIEAAFLGTAFKPVGKRGQDEVALWNAQEKALDRVPLTEFEVVSDPRPESGARVFWTLADQMNRPDGAFPYRYRPVDELVAEGFAGVAVDNLVSKGLIRRERRDDISRLLRYEQIRQRAVTQSLFEDSDPRPARRMAQTRAGLLSTILADFVREAGPKTYGPIEELKLVRTDDGVDRPVVSRRRAPLWVKPDLTMKYVVEITYAILENNTDLDLEQKEGEPQNNFRFTWKSKGQTKTADFDLSKLKLETDRLTPLSLIPPIEIDLADDPTGIFVSVERQSPNRKADLRFEPLPIEFANLPSEKLTRQVGLFAETEADLRLDLDRVRIVRNETDSDSDDWSRDRPIRIVPMSGTHGNDPIEEIQRWVVCLPPCQEFITDDETDSPAKSARVRVRLPVKFEEELLKSQLPRLNSFEIYRRFPWDSQPVKIAEGVPPNLRLVKDRDSAVLLVESFLFGEDFSFDLLTRRFEGTARGVVPGVTPIEYSLRAIPFGRLPSDTRDPVTLRWSAVTLYAPPAEKRLPALGLVFPVESLFDTDSNSKTIRFHLVDSRHTTWDWPEEGWDELEIWAEPRRISGTGSYAIDEDLTDIDAQAAERRAVRTPADLTADRLPQSVAGKSLVATVGPDRSTWKIDRKAFETGVSYRLYVRPKFAAQTRLVQPMDVYLIRKLPDFVDDATPLLHADTLELVDKNELRRILDPIEPKNQDQSWVPKSSVAIRRRSASDSLQERLSIEWDHLSDLDAGVEILTQDADELHRVTRRLATALEEAVFPTAIRDFRNPALWQTFLERTSDGGRDPETDLRRLRLEAPRLSPDELASSLLLWGVDINPPFDRLKKASNRLMGENFTTNDEDRTRIIEGVLAKYVAKENQNDWVELHRSLADYLAAIFAYQRTPLAPATPEDRTGLDAITAAARAMFLGLKVDPIVPTANPLHDLTSIHQGIVTREAILRKSLDDLATIDLSALHVNDAPDEYSRIKRKLQDIDLARRLARIIELRSSLAADILTSDGVAEAVSEAIDGDDPERLPGYNEWQDLAHQLFLAFSNVEKGNPTVVTTPSDHGLLTGQVVSISDVAGMTGLNGKTSKIEVIDGEKRKFRLVEIDSTNFGAYTGGGRALRDDMTYSKSLFDLFDGDLAVASGTGQAGAGELSNVLTRIRDPLNLLFKDNTGEVAKKYRNEVAGLVTQAAGLTAALDALKRDAEAQKWTLVRRPHHQIGIESTEPDGRTHVKQKLRDLLPDSVGGPNRSETEQPPPLTSEQLESLNPDGLIVPFSNLLERLGFAIDLAVVDNLNQPLSQRRLLQWLDGQAWSAIRATIGEFGHQVIIVSGREPDTGRDNPDTDSLNEDRSLGYGFVKLIVVPDCLLADLFGRRIEIPGVTINFDAQTLKLSVGFTATPLSQFRAKFGAQDRLMVIFKNIEPISFNIDKLEAIPASGNPASSSVTIDGYTGTLPAGAQTVEVVAVNGNRSNFRSWLKIRGIEPVTDDDTPAEKDLELRIVQKMARAWWQSTERLSFLDRKIKDPILHSIVETRSRRWATVPVLGGRAHLDWSADDAAGREILIAVRRVSRYEALLRWARGGAIPLVTRLYGRELDKYSQPVELARRMRAGIEEPATVPVLISPHPTRIDFVYALPTSGARATVSGLSARRNGFRGMGLHFSQKRLEAGESHQINQQDLIQKLQRRYLEDTITVTAVTTDFKWTVAFADTAPSAFDAIIVFDATHNKVRVCEQFTPEEGHPNQGTLQFVADPSGQFTPDLNSKLNVLIYRESGLKLQFPLGNVTGTIVRNGPDLRQFRLKPDPEADRLDENPRTYEGQLLFLLAQGKPTRVRVIKSFTPNDQILTLEQPLPNEVASSAVSILHGAPLPHRTPIVRSEGGTPTIFRYERQVSLPALPYYREYSLEVSPQFDAIPFGAPPDLADRKDTVFARRRPSLVAIHPALVTTTHKTNDSTEVTKHTFRLFLTRQGDLLTPQEAAVAVELDREDRLVRPSGTNAMLSENVSDADLPDLCCQYQLLWKIDESQEGNDVGAELVELLLPGHPLWAPPQNGTDGKANPVMLRNRTSVNVAKLEKESADPNGTASLCYLPIQVWQPTAAARPVYVVVFQVNITSDAALDDAKKMFWDPNRLVLQVQRGGYPSQLLPVFVDPS